MRTTIALAALLSAAFAMPALAEKHDTSRRQGHPDKTATHTTGHGNENGQVRGAARRDTPQVATADPRGTRVVTDRNRNVFPMYQRNPFAAGHCPPGLANKHNGCLPPGQARKL